MGWVECLPSALEPSARGCSLEGCSPAVLAAPPSECRLAEVAVSPSGDASPPPEGFREDERFLFFFFFFAAAPEAPSLMVPNGSALEAPSVVMESLEAKRCLDFGVSRCRQMPGVPGGSACG